MGKYFIISLGVALTWSVIPRGSSLGSRVTSDGSRVTGSVGSIKTGRPITILPRGQRSELGKVGRTLKGTIGSGQAEVRLKTNVGSIEIK